MERAINMAVYQLIIYMYEYNRLLQYRYPSDIACLNMKSKVDAMVTYLKAMGYPVSYGYGKVNCNRNDKPSQGFGYLIFQCDHKAVKALNIYENHGFENEIFWFMDGNGKPTEYKLRKRK